MKYLWHPLKPILYVHNVKLPLNKLKPSFGGLLLAPRTWANRNI